jgi:hypothetical protein
MGVIEPLEGAELAALDASRFVVTVAMVLVHLFLSRNANPLSRFLLSASRSATSTKRKILRLTNAAAGCSSRNLGIGP